MFGSIGSPKQGLLRRPEWGLHHSAFSRPDAVTFFQAGNPKTSWLAAVFSRPWASPKKVFYNLLIIENFIRFLANIASFLVVISRLKSGLDFPKLVL